MWKIVEIDVSLSVFCNLNFFEIESQEKYVESDYHVWGGRERKWINQETWDKIDLFRSYVFFESIPTKMFCFSQNIT